MPGKDEGAAVVVVSQVVFEGRKDIGARHFPLDVLVLLIERK